MEQRRCMYDESLSGVHIDAKHNTDFIQKRAVSPETALFPDLLVLFTLCS
jgi:hypothetical protein